MAPRSPDVRANAKSRSPRADKGGGEGKVKMEIRDSCKRIGLRIDIGVVPNSNIRHIKHTYPPKQNSPGSIAHPTEQNPVCQWIHVLRSPKGSTSPEAKRSQETRAYSPHLHPGELLLRNRSQGIQNLGRFLCREGEGKVLPRDQSRERLDEILPDGGTYGRNRGWRRQRTMTMTKVAAKNGSPRVCGS